MAQYKSILESMENEGYAGKQQFLEFIMMQIDNDLAAGTVAEDERSALLGYTYKEVEALTEAILKAETYKEKDLLFSCEDMVLGLIFKLCKEPKELPDDVFGKIKVLTGIVQKERCLENTLDKLFEQDTVNVEETAKLLELAANTADEYHKGQLYSGFVHYREQLDKLTAEAKGAVTAYFCGEFDRYLSMEVLSEDVKGSLELMADISSEFADDAVIDCLRRVLKLGFANVNYYVVETLLALKQPVSEEDVHILAYDQAYANLTYLMLGKYGKQDLFPRECTHREYLAASDLVHWLMYPTELGKAPDEIKYIGKVTYLFKKDVYHVFRYRSDSENLGEDLMGKWLIGWASEDGEGTFSNFDRYAEYKKDSVKATLRNIKKKLLG